VAQPRIGSNAGAARGGPRGAGTRLDTGSRRADRANYVGVWRRAARARLSSAGARVSFAVALCAVAWPGYGQLPSARARSGLELATRVEKIVAGPGTDKADARPQLVPAEDLSPGDALVVTVTFLNTTQHALDGVRITQPIPPSMRYVEGSGVGPGSQVLYSVDGGATYGQPNELGIVAADGVRRAGTAADYTHVRWLIKAPLAPGARAFVRFRATVRAASEPASSAPAGR
jgi:uncharacterized repeat protein (TIGR01451 family)